ncbi:uncharacterized protein VP01_2559g3 [Puccinia sorghi]|uniref:Uncharacterized protein n=1 Tax=Puccinia sorghi TaxID=27349 RepID=A0A0L6V597_9BASI|nr:uncharacterized protein VP01_2559g3 [Puccinia sorghi]
MLLCRVDQDNQLPGPPASAIFNWAKMVAASVELMADDLYKPAPPEAIQVGDQLVQGVLILKYLDSLKNLSSTFEITDNNPAPNQEVIERAHSVDVLHDLRNLIIDIFMGYIIIQTNALSPPPLTDAEKKKTYRKTRSSVRKGNSSSQALIQQGNTPGQPEKMTAAIAPTRDESQQQLQTIQSRHNFQPLIFFLIGGTSLFP